MARTEDEPSVGGNQVLRGLTIYTLFAGPAAQLLGWCNIHLSRGVDHIYIVLDRPGEAFQNALPQHDKITLLSADEAEWAALYDIEHLNVELKQTNGFRWVAERAHREGAQYVAFVDADELLGLRVPIADIVAEQSTPATAIRLATREMRRTVDDPLDEPFGATLALQPKRASEVNWPRLCGWTSQLMRDGFFGHASTKTIYRLPLACGDISVHGPKSGAIRAGAVTVGEDKGRILHFDCGSFATWRAKWASRLGGRTLATGLSAKRRMQQNLFVRELSRPDADQREFYSTFFSFSPEAIKVLDAASAIDRIDVREAAAGPLAAPALALSEDAAHPVPAEHDPVDMQFAFVTDENFAAPTFATLLSIASKLPAQKSLRFVVLGDGLSDASVSKFRLIEGLDRSIDLRVHDITKDLDRDVGIGDPKRATFGRIYLIDYLPPQRTVYLDGDVLATRDFSDIFALDLEGACLAGVPDSSALRAQYAPDTLNVEQQLRLFGITGSPENVTQYLNGGVLIMDLSNPDYHRLAYEARNLVINYADALKQRDQDALNIAFTGRKKIISGKYNYMTQFFVSERCVADELRARKYELADALLIHFSGAVKPWVDENSEFYNGLYRKMVREAEAATGLRCGFYFSRPQDKTSTHFSRKRLLAQFGAGAGGQTPAKPKDRVELVELSEAGADLALGSDVAARLRTGGYVLTAYSDGRRCFCVPLSRLSQARVVPVLDDLVSIRRLPFKLSEAMSDFGASAGNVHVFLERDGAAGGESAPHARHIACIERLRLAPASGPDADATTHAGELQNLVGARLTGWLDQSGGGAGPVSFFVNNKLVQVYGANGSGGTAEGETFAVDIKALRLFSVEAAVKVEARFAKTNVPLKGSPLSIRKPGHYQFDKATGRWREF